MRKKFWSAIKWLISVSNLALERGNLQCHDEVWRSVPFYATSIGQPNAALIEAVFVLCSSTPDAMTKVKYVGRPSLDFFGKYLSEIANNLCDRGIGRVVIKESEKRMYNEPCFYVIKEICPLMSDSVSLFFSS